MDGVRDHQDTALDWMSSQERRLSSVAIILENSDGQALSVKAHYKPYWSFPGGIIDKGETPKEAALREVHEEVGVSVDPTSLEFVAVIDRKSEAAQTYQFVFKAPLPQGDITLQADEIAESVFVSKEQVIAGDKPYGKVILHWANGVTGYIEQVFDNKG